MFLDQQATSYRHIETVLQYSVVIVDGLKRWYRAIPLTPLCAEVFHIAGFDLVNNLPPKK